MPVVTAILSGAGAALGAAASAAVPAAVGAAATYGVNKAIADDGSNAPKKRRPPSLVDPGKEVSDAARQRRRQQIFASFGRGATIASSPRGVSDPTPGQRKTLLGL